MRRYLLSAICLLSLTGLNNAAAQSWTTKSAVPGNTNDFDNPIYFSANNKIYVGGGIYSVVMKQYDPTTNTWTAKANIPGTTYSRVGAISFAANGKGYIGLGADFNSTTFDYTRKSDLLEYDPATDTYTPKASFPGTGRTSCAWFVVNNKVYVVGGADTTGSLDQVWEYNITSNTWTQKQAFPGNKITGASGFSIGTKGYIVLGNVKIGTGPASPTKKLFEYDPTTDTWTPKTDFPGTARFSSAAFVLNNKAYVGLGASVASTTSYNHYTDFYVYDPTTGWSTAITNFPGPGRQHLASAVANNKAYVGTGWTYINTANTYYKDWYEFSPTLGVNAAENAARTMSMYPNPANDIVYINSDLQIKNAQYVIYSIAGQKIAAGNIKDNKINIQNIPNGEYVVEVLSEGKSTREVMSIFHK